MKYFILALDQAYTAPRPQNWYGKLDPKVLDGKKHYQLPQRMIFQIEQNMQTVWTDMIAFPCFMVSDEARNMIGLYEPKLRFLRVIFSDKEKMESRAYHIPFLLGVDALTANSKFSHHKSQIHHAEIDASTMKDRTIVRITNVNQQNCILIRSDLAESLLSSDLIGIGLKEVDVVIPQPEERSKL
ncbi:MAG: hypothetical protein FWG67_05425 [Defluviitaleaceae bacterium]|nr:hypothetical protein [Defluviitaleaceae bacterium]